MLRLAVVSARCLPILVLFACGDDSGGSGDGTTGGDGESSTSLPPDVDSSSGAGLDSSSSEGGADTTTGADLPDPLPPLEAAPLTTDERLVPAHAIAAEPENDPRVVAQLEQMITDGYGDEDVVAGEPITDITADGSPAPAPGANPVLLARFVHLSDTQLPDDESPTRVAGLDSVGVGGAFRPQETYACNVLNAAARTINAVHVALPLDFAILGGDNADSAQTNEVQWFVDVLDGAPVVHCDSGVDDDPVPGPGNDPKDPFAPVGLDVPWRWVMGNHDVLVQGNFTIEAREDDAVGDDPTDQTRDWSQVGGPLFEGPVAIDETRDLLSGAELLDIVRASGDGHGISEEVAAGGKANYTFDVEGTALRFIVVDTAAQTGAASGLVRQVEVDAFLRPALDDAEAAGKWVILASHHASGSLGTGGGVGGTEQPDPLIEQDWQALVGEYTNVLAHLCGHSHVHRVLPIDPPGGHSYWEVITSSLADHPHQMRVIEIRDEDNGFVTMTATALDFSTQDDALAAEGRQRGITDTTSGWNLTGEGLIEDRNVRLWIPVE